MIILGKGISIAYGIGFGKPIIKSKEKILQSFNKCPDAFTVEGELDKIKYSIQSLLENLHVYLSTREDLLDMYLEIINEIEEYVKYIINNEKLCANVALIKAMEHIIGMLSSSNSQLINFRVEDIVDIIYYLLYSLFHKDFLQQSHRHILISDYISPIEIYLSLPYGLTGLVSSHGGITSHSAIVARSLGIPYVVYPSLDDILTHISDDSIILVDGYKGIIAKIEKEEVDKYIKIEQDNKKLIQKFMNEVNAEAITLDGIRVSVLANVNTLEDARLAMSYNADGIGLLRLEFMYMNRKMPPSEDELYNILSKISQIMNKREVIVRALDAGGDKPIPYLKLHKEENPFLGLRGIRLLLREHPEILYDEVKATLRAAADGGIFGFMIPMVSSLREVMEIRKIIEDAKIELENKNIKHGEIKYGIMVEVPSIVLVLDKVARYIDFISIGTNDLTQYLMAVDRTNENVQYLYNELSISSLKFINLIKNIANKYKLELHICVEVAYYR
ncbi:MAG: putative PEP-binding protein [Thermoproteus sp.]